MHNGIVPLAPKPGIGPLRSSTRHYSEGGFHALESWLYDYDYVDLERRRAAFLGSRRTSVWLPATNTKVAVTRSLPHTPAGTPTLVRDVGYRRIHVGVVVGIGSRNEKAAPGDGPSRDH